MTSPTLTLPWHSNIAKTVTPFSNKVTYIFISGKFPQALAEYEESIRRNPDIAKYHSNLGTVYIKLMEFPRARDCFEKALSKDPHYIKAYAKKGDCHFFLK